MQRLKAMALFFSGFKKTMKEILDIDDIKVIIGDTKFSLFSNFCPYSFLMVLSKERTIEPKP
jgi:hypothetical protein